MWTKKRNDLRHLDVKSMSNVPWSVDQGIELYVDQNPTVKKYNVERGERIPSFLVDENGNPVTGKRSRCKSWTKKTEGVLGKIARKEELENQVTSEKVVASYQEVKNAQPADAKKRKKRKNPGSRPRTPR